MITLTLLGVLMVPFVLIGGGLALFWKKRRRGIARVSIAGYGITVLAFLFGFGPFLLAWAVVHAGTRPMDLGLRSTPKDYGVAFEEIVFQTRDSLHLRGWFVPPTSKNAIVIYTHGLFRSRGELLERAMGVSRDGYGALLYDSRSHGASDKSQVSLGFYERSDVLGAFQYVQRRFQDSTVTPRIVLMGISMGAVATVEAAAECRGYSALILDSPFSSLRETAADHAWLFLKMPRYPVPGLFLYWFQRMTQVSPDKLDSHEALRHAQPVPLLLIASEGDRRISPEISRRLYAESSASVKELKVYGSEVGHGAAGRIYPRAYDELLLTFLHRALGDAPLQAEEKTTASERPPKQ